MPEFTRNTKVSNLTFVEEVYFSDLTKNTVQIAETLQLGRDEAGILDKKLDPDLLGMVSKIIEMLHESEYRDEAERELAALSDPDLGVAILRQAFRVRTGRVNALLVEKLSTLCQTEQGKIAREAVQDATGSELQRLSQLADQVFLNIGTEAELAQIAADWQRSLNVRIQACTLLIERYHSVDAVMIALDLFVEGASRPDSHELLKRLSRSFSVLETLEESKIQDGIIEPLLNSLQQHQRDVEVRRFLLGIVRSLHRSVLNHIQQIPPLSIYNDMWLALALRECAKKDPAGTQQMISLLANQNVNDRFRLELSRRIKDKQVKFTQGMIEQLKLLLEKSPHQHAKEMRENIELSIENARGHHASTQPKDLFKEILAQYRADGDIDEDTKLLWDFRHNRGSLNYLRTQLKSIDKDDLDLVLTIVSHERFRGQWGERLRTIIEIYPRLTLELKRKAIPSLYEIAQNEPAASKDWSYANEFLANLVDAGEDDSELARRYWKKLGETGK